METSLSRQLSKLKAPQTSAFKEVKSRASFLYDQNEARSIDIDTHFAVALTGLETLSTIYPFVESFRGTLFREESKELERGLLSEQENENLNEEVKRFLYEIVSPYLLLTPTHKMLEWMIVKYRVNEYNVEDLILCSLPYHETKLFSKVIQLVKSVKDEKSCWHWLKPIAKHGLPLSKQTLINHCKSDLGFLNYVFDAMLLKTSNISSTTVRSSLLIAVVLNTIDTHLTEEIAAIIIQHMDKGLKMKNKTVTTACFIIIAFLTYKILLDVNVVKMLLKRMLRAFRAFKNEEDIREHYLLAVITIFNNQMINQVPKSFIEEFDFDSLKHLLLVEKASYFLIAVIGHLIENCEDVKKYDMLQTMLQTIDLSELVIEKCLETVFMCSKHGNVGKRKLSLVMSTIERRFPDHFDACISRMSHADVKDLLVSSLYVKVGGCHSSVQLALCHANKEIRLAAISHLEENVDDILNKDIHIKASIVRSIRVLLEEESHEVIKSVMSKQTIFRRLFDQKEIIYTQRNLLKRVCLKLKECRRLENVSDFMLWMEVATLSLKLLCEQQFSDEKEFLQSVLPFLFPKEERDINLFRLIINSDSATCSALCVHLKKFDSEEVVKFPQFVNNLTKNIAMFYTQMKKSPLLELMYESGNVCHQIYSLFIMHQILSDTKDFSLYNETSIRVIILHRRLIKKRKQLKRSSNYSSSFEELIADNLELLESDMVPENLLYFVLKEVISFAILPDVKPGWFWHTQIIQNSYIYSLFIFLCDYCFHRKAKISNLFRGLLQAFAKKMVKCVGVSFFASLWTKIDNESLQARSLAISVYNISRNSLLNEIETVSLLIALNSKCADIRRTSLQVLKNVRLSNNDIYNYLVDGAETIETSCAVSKIIDNLQHKEPKRLNDFLKSLVEYATEEGTPVHVKYGILSLLKSCSGRQFVEPFINLLHFGLKCCEDSFSFKICEEILFKMTVYLQGCTSADDDLIPIFFNSLKIENVRTFCLKKMKSSWFTKIECDAIRVSVLKNLLNLFVECRDNCFRKRLSKLLYNSNHVVEMIDSFTMSSSAEENATKRRRTVCRIEMSLEQDSWKKVMILLEILTEKETLHDSTCLMKTLFSLLKESFTIEERPSLEYFRFLLLASIGNCLKQSDCDKRLVDIQCVLESFRHCRRRETQREALLLVNTVTPYFKEEILHNVMLIFGFIGSNMIQCDDEFSLKVMDETMSQVIPVVTNGDEVIQDNVVEVFIDAIKDIAAHRRLHLFRKLSSLLNEESHLWFIVFKLTERVATMSKADQKDFLDFARILVSSYDPVTQLLTFATLIKVASLLDGGSTVVFRRKVSFATGQRQEIVQLLISNLLNMVSSLEFKSKIDQCEWQQTQPHFNQFMESLLSLNESLAKENLNKRAVGYSKTVIRTLHKILENIHVLLPPKEMLCIIESLLLNENIGIQRKALEIFNSMMSESIIKMKYSLLSRFIHHLCDIVCVGKQTSNDSLLTNSQMALLSIKLLTKCYRQKEKTTQLFEKCLQLVINMLNELNTNGSQNVIACAILCVTQVTVTIENRAIPFLPSIVSIILKYFISKSAVVVLSCVTALTKIIRHFSQFLGTNLTQLISMSCNAKVELKDDAIFYQKFKIVKNYLATMIPVRVLMESIGNAYNELSTKSEEPILSLLSIFYESISHIQQLDLEANLPSIQKFVFTALDYRNINWKSKTVVTIEAVEDKTIQCVIAIVPKLSEKTFRPFFYKLYDWAIRAKDTKGQLQRVVTFYRMMNELAETLRSLFCLFAAPYIVNNCVHLLDTVAQSGVDESTIYSILTNVVLTVSKCFAFDDGSFATRERLEKLVPSLINQLNTTVGSVDMQDYLVKECLTKCVENFVRAVSDSTIVKDIHYKLLLKTREDSAKIRLNALHVYHKLVLAMKGEYLPLLPEAVSFLAELNEDDNSEVQKLLIDIFHDVEEVVGEPISEYF